MKRGDNDEGSKRTSSSAADDDASSNALSVPQAKKRRADSSDLQNEEAAMVFSGRASIQSSSMSKVSPQRKVSGQSKSRGGGGRMRLPEKLLKYLNDEPVPDVVWWMPDGNGFAYNIDTVQTGFLDKFFRGTKLTSFVRSLNRW